MRWAFVGLVLACGVLWLVRSRNKPHRKTFFEVIHGGRKGFVDDLKRAGLSNEEAENAADAVGRRTAVVLN
jgi:hypothetical protein